MTAEPKSLRVGETLRLRIVAHVDENILQLDNVTLPDLSGFDSLGDERRCSTSGHGSDCVEVMTLSPTEAGDRTIAPTTLDAIDARNGKPSHFATNSVTIHVGGSVRPNEVTRALLDDLLKPIAILLIVGAAAYALLWGFVRRKPPPAPVSPPARPVTPAAPTDPLAPLVAALARERTRACVLAVRAELRRRVGAREDETLDDLLARRAAGDDPAVPGALPAVERAAFIDDSQLDGAIDDALRTLSKWHQS